MKIESLQSAENTSKKFSFVMLGEDGFTGMNGVQGVEGSNPFIPTRKMNELGQLEEI